MDVITETDKLNLETVSGKFIFCNPYHYDDPISRECTKSIKNILENQLSTNVRMLIVLLTLIENIFICIDVCYRLERDNELG